MAKYRIAWMPGDGIGNDVMEAARMVLDILKIDAEYIPADIGWEFWKTEGNPLPERTINIMKNTDCALFGAITSKPKDEAARELAPELRGKGYVYSSPIVGLRQKFDLHTNMRPCKAFPGNPLNYKDDIDIVVFRENTEGLYSGVEWSPVPDDIKNTMVKNHDKMRKFENVSGNDLAISTRIFTRKACKRILRSAFEYAKKDGRKTVTVVEKPNVIRETSGMMVNEARKMQSTEYPDIELWETNIDAQCMWLVKNPEDYSILVSSNMFGDIISDLSAQLVGGLGYACSANIGDEYAVFEPTHGSAPKYFGKNVANPTAMLLSVRLMLQYLGEEKKTQALYNAIGDVIAQGKFRTKDTGGNTGTKEMANAIIEKLKTEEF